MPKDKRRAPAPDPVIPRDGAVEAGSEQDAKTAAVNFRTTPAIRQWLDTEAARNSRSMAQQVEWILLQHRERLAAAGQVYEVTFGPEVWMLALGIAWAMSVTASIVDTQVQATGTFDPFTFDQLVTAATTFLEGLRPEGSASIVPPMREAEQVVSAATTGSGPAVNLLDIEIVRRLITLKAGESTATMLLNSIAAVPGAEVPLSRLTPYAAEARAKLPAAVVELLQKRVQK
jgi:hypothetical protein